MQIELTIPQPEAELLLVEAALREVSAEELLAEIIKNYIGRTNGNG